MLAAGYLSFRLRGSAHRRVRAHGKAAGPIADDKYLEHSVMHVLRKEGRPFRPRHATGLGRDSFGIVRRSAVGISTSVGTPNDPPTSRKPGECEVRETRELAALEIFFLHVGVRKVVHALFRQVASVLDERLSQTGSNCLRIPVVPRRR